MKTQTITEVYENEIDILAEARHNMHIIDCSSIIDEGDVSELSQAIINCAEAIAEIPNNSKAEKDLKKLVFVLENDEDICTREMIEEVEDDEEEIEKEVISVISSLNKIKEQANDIIETVLNKYGMKPTGYARIQYMEKI